jgi:glycosyltransferase involved in cell wall biosynthesis
MRTLPCPVNIIEPTLEGVSGHSLNVVRSLCAAGAGLPFRLWAGRAAKLSELQGIADDVRPYFRRRLRKLQVFLLYRRLLGEPGPIVVTTAGTLDLYALDWAARKAIPRDKVYLYFHQVRRLTDKKRERFRRLAARQPNLVMLGTTPAIERVFRESGFAHSATLSLPPGLAREAFTGEERPFRHLLYAGAARADKGFDAVVDLVAHLAAVGSDVPITVQTCGDHYGRYDPSTRAQVERLRSLAYRHLHLLPDPLMPKEYGELFSGGISLQPYRREEYAAKMSAITLDSLSAGCPVVTVAGTSMAQIVERFDAGAVVGEAQPEALHGACEALIADYARYRENARRGGETIREENSWAPLVRALRERR